ncbi:MAG: hypothetical protein K6G32_10985 [Prevotella sp.]|nr:hypothetical protein [Prevotella sp.]
MTEKHHLDDGEAPLNGKQAPLDGNQVLGIVIDSNIQQNRKKSKKKFGD